MKKCIALCLAFVFGVGIAGAQSADKITELLSTEKMTFGQTAYLTASYQNLIKDSATDEDAVRALVEKDILPIDAKPSEIIRLDEACYLIGKATGLKGGLFYTLFPGPRYSCKEFKAKGIVPSAVDPKATITGREALALLGACTKNEGAE